MNPSVWRDVRSWNGGRSGSRDVIVGLRDGDRIWRVSPDTTQPQTQTNAPAGGSKKACKKVYIYINFHLLGTTDLLLGRETQPNILFL